MRISRSAVNNEISLINVLLMKEGKINSPGLGVLDSYT